MRNVGIGFNAAQIEMMKQQRIDGAKTQLVEQTKSAQGKTKTEEKKDKEGGGDEVAIKFEMYEQKSGQTEKSGASGKGAQTSQTKKKTRPKETKIGGDERGRDSKEQVKRRRSPRAEEDALNSRRTHLSSTLSKSRRMAVKKEQTEILHDKEENKKSELEQKVKLLDEQGLNKTKEHESAFLQKGKDDTKSILTVDTTAQNVGLIDDEKKTQAAKEVVLTNLRGPGKAEQTGFKEVKGVNEIHADPIMEEPIKGIADKKNTPEIMPTDEGTLTLAKQVLADMRRTGNYKGFSKEQIDTAEMVVASSSGSGVYN